MIKICRAQHTPFSPSGEKVADRPDEVAFIEGSVVKRPPYPGPLTHFFVRKLPWDPTQHPQKTGGEGEIWRCLVLLIQRLNRQQIVLAAFGR